MNEEEKEAIEYFEEKIKNKLPLYTETYVDGKPYRRNILQLETNFTEEQANKTRILLNLIDKQQKELKDLKEIEQAHKEENGKLRVELEKEKQYSNFYKDLCDRQQKEIKDLKEKNKELENADLTTVYMNGFYDGEKKWKDKIKELLHSYSVDDKRFAKYLQELLEEK